MDIKSYQDLDNPIQIVWRKGTADDPYIERMDIAKVVHQRIILSEIPDKLFRVRISGMEEINYEKYVNKNISENEYYVDYSNGFVFFHANKEATTVTILYKGMGFVLYPSSRITHVNAKGATENLDEIINESLKQLEALKGKTDDFESLKEKIVVTINHANLATDEAKKSADEAKTATDLAFDAYETTKLVYREYVDTYDDILSTYPNPEIGWTVQVYETGIRYRFNGREWVPIDILGKNMPLANDYINGLMSKEDYIKLKNIQDGANKKIIGFVQTGLLPFGILNPHFPFPFKGKIEKIRAICSESGVEKSIMHIEKSTDMVNWTRVTENPITIMSGAFFDDESYSIIDDQVQENSVLRVDCIKSGELKNLTLEITIKLI